MAGLVPAIHVFLCSVCFARRVTRRGWLAFASHADGGKAAIAGVNAQTQ
jgi:hypothetical protein